MKNILNLILSITLVFSFVIFATNTSIAANTYSTVSNGDWTVDANWNSAPSTNNCSSAGTNTFVISNAITSTCNPLSFSGNVTIHVLAGGSFTITGSGGLSGNVNLIVDLGGTVIVTGNLNLSGSFSANINGTLSAGSITGGGSAFDCNGSSGTGSVTVSSGSCNCSAASASGCTVSAPVTLLVFDAVYSNSNKNTTLLWETTNEVNNSHFTIEKSYDGFTFEGIANINAKSSQSSVNEYQYEDEKTNEITNIYYRLKQVDLNGQYTLSKIVNVVVLDNNNFDLRVFPNPSSSSDFTVSFYGVSQPISLIIYDIHGSELFAKTITVQDNNIVTAKDINSNLNAGIYYIHASVQGKSINKKLIIQ